jgi:hypothetical protein
MCDSIGRAASNAPLRRCGAIFRSASATDQKVTAMDALTPDEQEILDGLLVKSQLPGYDPMLDTTEEERRIAAKYIVICLQQLAALGIRSQIVIASDTD